MNWWAIGIAVGLSAAAAFVAWRVRVRCREAAALLDALDTDSYPGKIDFDWRGL